LAQSQIGFAIGMISAKQSDIQFETRFGYRQVKLSNISGMHEINGSLGTDTIAIIAGIAAVIGHIWTIFAGFKGGKGIATGLGVLISVVTLDLLMALGVFLLVMYFSKYISLASMSAAVSVPIIMVVRENIFGVDIPSYHTVLPFVIALALLVIYTHRANLERLLSGNENKISFSKKYK